MKIALVGVLEDGTPRRAGVPIDSRANLSIVKGTDVDIEVSVVTPSGSAVGMTGSDELLMTIKRRPQDGSPKLSLTGTLSGNKGTFSITPNDTRRFQPGLLGYDVWLTKGSKRDPVIPLSPLTLLASNVPRP